MVSTMHDELLALTAALRVHLEDARLRGYAGVPALDPELLAAARASQATPRAVADAPPANPGWGEVARAAREVPRSGAAALAAIRADLGDCRRCPLHEGRRNIVFGGGHPEADLVIVGEGPGREEDRRGEPFVGAAGQMLDKMLIHVLGLPRSEVHILNVVKCRPPNNRDPHPREAATCMPFLERQLEALQPKVILVLGRIAASYLVGTRYITRARGRWHRWRDVPVMPTFHPAYLLRKPQDKRLVFEDLKAVRARYDALGGRR